MWKCIKLEKHTKMLIVIISSGIMHDFHSHRLKIFFSSMSISLFKIQKTEMC